MEQRLKDLEKRVKEERENLKAVVEDSDSDSDSDDDDNEKAADSNSKKARSKSKSKTNTNTNDKENNGANSSAESVAKTAAGSGDKLVNGMIHTGAKYPVPVGYDVNAITPFTPANNALNNSATSFLSDGCNNSSNTLFDGPRNDAGDKQVDDTQEKLAKQLSL